MIKNLIQATEIELKWKKKIYNIKLKKLLN